MRISILRYLLTLLIGAAHAQEAPVTFQEDFESPAALSRFDFAIHHPVLFFEPIRSWKGDHSRACAAPPSTRDIGLPGNRSPGDGKTYDLETGDAVYWCAPGGPGTGHLMTTFNTNGYAQVDFSPRHIFEDVSGVCWDQNMTDLGARKWTQLVIVGKDTFEANGNRMDYVSTRVDDGPASLATLLSGDTFMLEVLGGSTVVHTGRSSVANFRGYTNDDKRRRFTICVTDLEDGTVKIELERESTTETRVLNGAMPNGPARVIFQDDTYNAPKSPPRMNVSDPFTWHWDNIVISSLRSSALSPVNSPTAGSSSSLIPGIILLLEDVEVR